MSVLELKIRNIKNIKEANFTIPIEKGVYAITGTNGSGKSTIINCLGKLVVDFSIYSLEYIDNALTPSFTFSYEGKQDVYMLREVEIEKDHKGHKQRKKLVNRWISDKGTPNISFDGLFEGSFFFGKRFTDSIKIDKYLNGCKGTIPKMYDVDPFIGDNVSMILHNDTNHYKNLKHLGLAKAKYLGFKNDPCFVTYGNNIVSQYSMSSGECLLLSLFAFINNVVGEDMEESSISSKPTLIIIDEIEAALHPSAIKRLMDYFNCLAYEHNFVIIISSHSAEVIRQINPRNLYNIERTEEGCILVSNPCYPSYAIRDVYTHVGYDIVILTEDNLARKFVDDTITEMRLGEKRLFNILPVGGWENVLKLYTDLVNNNYFGPSTQVFCVLDGDVQSMQEYKKYRKSPIPKMFLPIPSVEKFMQAIVLDAKYSIIKAKLNSYIFRTDTIDSLYKAYYDNAEGHKIEDDKDGKNFFSYVINYLSRRGISEDDFISKLSTFVNETTDSTQFKENLKKQLEL